nr:Chain A, CHYMOTRYPSINOGEN B CHAIN A [Rattus norvegicus]
MSTQACGVPTIQPVL